MSLINFKALPIENKFLIEEGVFPVTIERAELRNNKKPTGQHVNVMFRLEDNRVLFYKFNIINTNAIARRIGNQEFSKLLRAVHLEGIADPEELVARKLVITVAIKENKQYGEQNVIKSFDRLFNPV